MLLFGRLPRSSITYRAVRFRPATSAAMRSVSVGGRARVGERQLLVRARRLVHALIVLQARAPQPTAYNRAAAYIAAGGRRPARGSPASDRQGGSDERSGGQLARRAGQADHRRPHRLDVSRSRRGGRYAQGGPAPLRDRAGQALDAGPHPQRRRRALLRAGRLGAELAGQRDPPRRGGRLPRAHDRWAGAHPDRGPGRARRAGLR